MSDRATSPLAPLRTHTSARIALGTTGTSLPTAAHLDFQLAHARARNAVHTPLDVAGLMSALAHRGLQALHLCSAAGDRQIYLRRPDLGRRLHPESRARLQAAAPGGRAPTPDREGDARIALVLGDGLSPRAIQENALSLLDAWRPLAAREGWGLLSPVVVVEQARVAIADEIGELLGADLVAILIGERPGLSAADSLGVYMTHAPRVGLNDASRNCISNVRPAGLGPTTAAATLHYLMRESLLRRLSGVELKDETPAAGLGSDRRDTLLHTDPERSSDRA